MKTNNTATIARNSSWQTAYSIFQLAMGTTVAIAMARVIGPKNLAYFAYVMWLTSITGSIGSLGLPNLLAKYMAEYVGRNDLGMARAIFSYTLLRHGALALLITALSMIVIVVFGDPTHRTVAAIQILTIFPNMMISIPSWANNAREDVRSNSIACYIGDSVEFAGVGLSLILGYGLPAIAASMLLARLVELTLKMTPVLSWVRSMPIAELPLELKRRMVAFSLRSTVLLILNIVVWDRSDVIFLKMLASAPEQISFFTVTFGLVEKVLMVPRGIISMIGVTMFAQYGRDKSRLLPMTATAVRYALLMSIPCFLGVACLASPLIRLAYGAAYIPAIPVLVAATLLAIPKPLTAPAYGLLQAHERQGFIITWSLVCGALNVVLDIVLIPKMGALGAAIANGSAQAVATFGIWAYLLRHYEVDLDVANLREIVFCSLAIVATAWPLGHFLPPVIAVAVAVPVGAFSFFLMLRLRRVITPEDRKRLVGLDHMLPARLRSLYMGAIDFVAPRRPPLAESSTSAG